MNTILTLLLVWFVLRDWPDVIGNLVDLYDSIQTWRTERYWKRRDAERRRDQPKR